MIPALDVLHLCGRGALGDRLSPLLEAVGMRAELVYAAPGQEGEAVRAWLGEGRDARIDAVVVDGDVSADEALASLPTRVPVLTVGGLPAGALSARERGGRMCVGVGAAAGADMLADAARMVAETARRGLERERERVQDGLLSVLDVSRTYVVVLDAHGRIRYLNEAARVLAGVGAGEDVRGADPGALFTADDALAIAGEALPRAVETGRWTGRVAVRGGGGAVRTLACELFAPREGADPAAGWTILGHDLGDMVGGGRDAGVALPRMLVHEVGNALSVLMGSAEAALATGDRGDVFAALARCLDGAHRIRELVVAPTRPFGASAVDIEPVDVAAVVRRTAAFAEREVERAARLVVDIRRVPLAMGSAGRLAQVVLNLLLNAAQAIPRGDPDANTVTIGCRLAEDGRVLVEVADTGVGIGAEVVEAIFRPLYTSQRGAADRGWGLHVVRTLVAEVGGEVMVESQVGAGSRFTVALAAAPEQPAAASGPPVRRAPMTPPFGAAVVVPRAGGPSSLAPAPIAPGSIAPASVAPPAARRPRVLLVDDEPLLLRAVRRLLLDAYDVELASGGGEALARLQAGERYDLILCDLMMPGMSGMALHAALTALDGALAERMVFLTGGAQSPEALAFLERQRHPWLRKPFDQTALRTHVRQALTRLGDAD